MGIDDFVIQSEGEWNSMRSGHSLAFKQFEEVISKIKITLLGCDHWKVKSFLQKTNYSVNDVTSPFQIDWSGNSEWSEDNQEKLTGSSLLLPIANSEKKGILLRSLGYAEKIQAISKYCFSSDDTLILSTVYAQTIAEERIWFINENVRCRSTVIKSLNEKSILQTSFSSEIRKINI